MKEKQNQEVSKIDVDDVDAIIRNNNYKLTADKIREKLSKVLNDPSQSSKRWIWELMQNAKDLKNKFEKVSVEIELSTDKLVFRHNGNPFRVSNITGLIQQVSSKDSGNSDESVTGKFGTGFIATHLLSEIITVKGIVNHKNHYKDFEVVLDRSGRTSEELLPKIESALEKIRKIETDPIFSVKEDYEVDRVEADFDTSFEYPLVNKEKLDAAKDGLSDLKNTLPLTLVNIPKIKNVRIVDHISSTKNIYKSEEVFNDGKIRKTKIKLSQDDTHCFITYYTKELSLSIEVNNFEELKLIENFGKTPNLYRDFPLIGSDKFYFPFIFNGYKLHPTEDRDGIPIHSESAPDHIENRALVEKGFEAAKKFTDYLIEIKSKNLFVCAFSRLPDEKWQTFSKSWFEKLQKNYRAFINEKDIIETDIPSCVKLNTAFIPIYGETDTDKISFYEIVKPFIGVEKLPKKDILISWIKATGPKDELKNWDRELRYTLEILLSELEVVGSLKSLSNKLNEKEEPLTWLNKFYSFLINFKETDSFSTYAIIPNQNGDFKKLSPNTLHLEDKEANIPDEFLDILFDLGDNWRTKLIHREVKLPGQNIEKKGLPLASNKINELITKDTFRRNSNSFKIVKDILRNVTSIENIENFRCEVYLKGKELFSFDEGIRVVSNIKDFRFKNALDIFIETVNTKIQKCKDINGLSEQLNCDRFVTIKWLNTYLNKIKSAKDFSSQIFYGNIVPNRNEVFCAFDSLNNFGTVETSLNDELIDILFKLDKTKNWKNELVLDGIEIKCTPKTFDELGSAVDSAIREIEKEEAVNLGYINSYKETIIELINWCNLNNSLSKYLAHFLQRKNDLWVKFSMTDKMFSLLRNEEALEMLEVIQDSGISKESLNQLIALFPEGVPPNVIEFAKEDARKKKDFNNLLEIGSKVEVLFKKTLERYQITNEIIHAGGGAYDIRIYNPDTKKSFYIELKSCRYQNPDPINIAVSQAKRAVKELENENFSIVIIERSSNNVMNEDYIKLNTKYFKNPGKHLALIGENFDAIESSSNTNSNVDLKMDFAEFKGALDYKWVLNEIGNSGFNELLVDIKSVLN
ncbi:sacsin N-terminal ATP-binding-like domain-containing protein [Polaribacter staleyi]|uniref:sacsin N-terminal ATP-binding-like domain-containing protein n=1 Tax=Polaribacter staleyi TaxID=2022337 RepID=UPI0031B9E087